MKHKTLNCVERVNFLMMNAKINSGLNKRQTKRLNKDVWNNMTIGYVSKSRTKHKSKVNLSEKSQPNNI